MAKIPVLNWFFASCNNIVRLTAIRNKYRSLPNVFVRSQHIQLLFLKAHDGIILNTLFQPVLRQCQGQASQSPNVRFQHPDK